MRLFCDENIRDTTAQWLRGLRHDVVSVKEANITGASDDAVLSYAIREGRVLLTFNTDFSDVRQLDAIHHAGIIRRRSMLQTEEEVHPMLEKALESIVGRDLTGMLITVKKDKVRYRHSGK